jgi:hypothetical protein
MWKLIQQSFDNIYNIKWFLKWKDSQKASKNSKEMENELNKSDHKIHLKRGQTLIYHLLKIPKNWMNRHFRWEWTTSQIEPNNPAHQSLGMEPQLLAISARAVTAKQVPAHNSICNNTWLDLVINSFQTGAQERV